MRIVITILTCLMLTGCCGVGLHIDEYGARIGAEKIERYEDLDGNKVYHMKVNGFGIFWFPLFTLSWW